jgi:hypothetical protein
VAHYEIKAVIGSNDIQFQLWFRGFQYSSRNSIKVEWLEGAAVSPPDDSLLLDREDLLGDIRRRPAVPDRGRGRQRGTVV